jgi:ligand-binding sensor domain-containing protein
MNSISRTSGIFRKKYFSAAFFVLLGLGVPSRLFSLDPQKSIAQYGQSIWLRQNGLPANAVNAVLQTHDGYILFGTSAGLYRFDGVNFTKMAVKPANDQSFESISALLETKDSSLWIGTQYRGLRRIKNGTMFHYGLKEGFFDTQVKHLLESRDGHLLIATSIGLYTFEGGKFLPVLLDPNFITDITQDVQGRIWIGSYYGVRVFDDNRLSQVMSVTTADGLPNDITTSVYADHLGNVWIGTANGLACWNNGKITVYTTLNGLSENHIITVYGDQDGNIWVGTNEGGLDRFSGGRWSSFTKSNGLSNNQVLSMAEDYEKSLWVCTSDGLNQFKDVNLTTFTTYDGLASDYISNVIETTDGAMNFLSSEGSNIVQLKNGKITKFGIWVGPAYAARDGSLWVGQNGMLNRIKNDRVTHYDTTMGLPSRWISAITEDDKSLVIFEDHIGIRRFVNGRLKPYLMADGKQYPSTDFVLCFYPERKGVLWVGMTDSLVKIENGKSTHYTVANGLAGNWVSSIYGDHDGNIWIGCPQGGLTRYRDGKFTAYSTRTGLIDDEIYCILGDDQGGLWFSGPNGIEYVQQQELNDFAEGRIDKIDSKIYTTVDGMKTDQCFGNWQPGAWKTRDGQLWFATSKGAVLINPKKFKQNLLKPPVLIEQVVVDQKLMPTDQLASLSPGADKLEFHYTALSYLVPERVHFRYKLEGYDKDWVEAGTRRVAYYTSLPPNKYRFRVIACNNDGVWNETGASFAFELQPHFYETMWFFVLILFAAGAMVVGGYEVRLMQLLRRKKELETNIQEAMANIRVLGGLIPICSNCKKIRNDKGYWDILEGYIQQHSEAKFSHGICPECANLLYPDVFPKKT